MRTMVLRSIGLLASLSAYPKALKYASLPFSKTSADTPIILLESTKFFSVASIRFLTAASTIGGFESGWNASVTRRIGISKNNDFFITVRIRGVEVGGWIIF